MEEITQTWKDWTCHEPWQPKERNYSTWMDITLAVWSGLIWTSQMVCTIVVPTLGFSIILGLPSLLHNCLVIDYEAHTVIQKDTGINLLNYCSPESKKRNQGLRESIVGAAKAKAMILKEFKAVAAKRQLMPQVEWDSPHPLCYVAASHQHLKVIAIQSKLIELGKAIKIAYEDVFRLSPHTDVLPTDVYCQIKLKDTHKMISTWTYSTPHKYHEAWAMLIQQHLDAGQIRLSSSAHASPSFFTPKIDSTILPCWVNDYHLLNANMVMDAYPLYHVDDVLADCTWGKIWSKFDMTNSFFQTRIHSDDISLTVVTTLLWPIWMASDADGLQKCASNLSAVNGYCIEGAYQKILPCLLGQYSNLVRYSGKTCRAHQKGPGRPPSSESVLQPQKMSLLSSPNWFSWSLYLGERNWSK